MLFVILMIFGPQIAGVWPKKKCFQGNFPKNTIELEKMPKGQKRATFAHVLLEALGELWGILGAALRNSENDSRNAKFRSRNGISRLEQHETISICPCLLVSHHCCDSCRAYTVSRAQCRSKFPQFSRCRWDVALLGSRLRTPALKIGNFNLKKSVVLVKRKDGFTKTFFSLFL